MAYSAPEDEYGCSCAEGGDQVSEQAEVVLRGYILQSMRHDNCPGVNISAEDLGGSQSESTNPEVKDIVRSLIQIGDELSRNTELEYLIDHIEFSSAQEVFNIVAKRIFEDGINWGRVVALFHFAYKLICKAITSNCKEMVRRVMYWALGFFRTRISWWVREQGGWGAVQSYFQSLNWPNVALFVAGVLTGAMAYWKMS
ncbi:apoptosis regulator BAX [Erpetoichthys calabaricus]|uniref:Apoptosis regulator BAX-like n=1 Tax=Erpetoichthys calabaricus TaxID=27687 RepID=A0A8C4T7F8_ERPCA|nr:apoptosis regulator BAX [Erpetoichthys calabaricus]